jgi:hypothetical protein
LLVHVEADVTGVSFCQRHAQWERNRANWRVREEHPLVVIADTVEQHELRGVRHDAAEMGQKQVQGLHLDKWCIEVAIKMTNSALLRAVMPLHTMTDPLQ